jgi:hypothetical protein
LNDGEGHFTPVDWTGGVFRDETGRPLEEPPRDWGLSVMFRDLNGDLAPDIYVCNDFYHWRDRIWINDGGGAFQAIEPMVMRNMSMSSMSIDFADINRDQAEDFFVVDMLSRDHSRRHRQRANVTKGLDQPIGRIDYRPEVPRNTLYLNRGDGTYAEIAQLSGLEASEWSWSTLFLDVDLDGYEDVLITNGHGHDVLDADVLRELANQGQETSLEDRVQNLRRFPPLHTANLAFHNRGQAEFVERGTEWGWDTVGISHGMATADLDRDGDLDLVVNHYNTAAGLYRNESAASRVVVRLAGQPPNVQGIGARITIEGGPVLQQQAVIGGGRYLSGDDPVRMFAAGEPGNELTIRVTWRSGRQSRITSAKANRIYEIREPAGPKEEFNPENESHETSKPYFVDVSDWLSHEHQDKAFDDFARQPLLPRRLSQPGPGVAWYDLDGDGWEDLILGAGDGGRLAVFHNRRGEQFERVATPEVRRDQTTVLGWSRGRRERLLLAGSSNYEDGSEKGGAVHQYNLFRHVMEDAVPGHAAGVGPLAMGDLDNDGDLDLFVGGRVLSGRYPQPVTSRIYHNEKGAFELDTEHRELFEKVGLVNGAVWSDLNGDGSAELILACDWGPIRVYQNQSGQLRERTEFLGLAEHRGWWNGVATGDFDEDGRLDIVASNWDGTRVMKATGIIRCGSITATRTPTTPPK